MGRNAIPHAPLVATELWDVALPTTPRRLPGLAMAGFRERVDRVDVRMLPHPAVTLAFDLAGHLQVDDPDGRRHQGSVVGGLATGGYRVRGRHIECLQVRLSPVLAGAVLAAAPDLGATIVGLDELWGRDAARLEERLRATESWHERFAIVEDSLIRRIDGGRAVDPEIAGAWQQMGRTGGQVRVEQIADELGWSRKRLWTRFRSQIGLTPKRAAQLVRFDAAAHRLAAGNRAADVAAVAGYADQSHLNRDVASFAGLTPTAVAASAWLSVDDVAWASS